MALLIPLSVLAVFFGLLYVPVLWELAQVWWIDSNYSHGFLIPLIIAYLIWNRKDRLAQIHVKPSAWGSLVLILGLVLLLVGSGIEMAGGGRGALFVKGISFMLALGGAMLLLAGKDLFKAIMFPFVYLVFMIPLPVGIFTMVTGPLQSYATGVTTSALHLLNIPALREGHIIYLPALALGVNEACSGIRSLLTLLAGVTVLSYLALPFWWQRLILVASVVPIAIVTNAFRVIATGLLAYFGGEALARGFFHGFAGLALLIMSSLLLCMEMMLFVKLPAEGV